MKFKVIPTITALVVSSILCVTPWMTSYSYAQNQAEIQGKNEIVYGNLDAKGRVDSVYVVNQFSITKEGMVTDFGDYSSVLNLTTTNPVTLQDNAVTFEAPSGTFYYQRNLENKNFPWLLSLTYYLDGKEMDPVELAGKSGDLTISFTTRQNTDINPAFYENYMLQAAFSLENDVFTNIQADGATIASAGQKTSVNFTVMPNKDTDASITAHVTNFHMEGIQISGIPFAANVDFSETDGMLDEFNQLAEAISELHNGVSDLDSGAGKLSDNASKIASGSSSIQNGLVQLSDNSTQIIGGSSQIQNALITVASALSSSASHTDMDSFSTLIQTLAQMADGLKGISNGLTELNTGYQMSYKALDQAVNSIPDISLTNDQISNLYAAVSVGDSSQLESLDTLLEVYKSALTIKSTYQHVKAGFDAIDTTINTLVPTLDQMENGLKEISQQMNTAYSDNDITAQISQLTAGLSELSSNYTVFHNGLVSYMNGVTQLSNGYVDFQNGLSQYSDGMNSFQDGMSKLNKGTEELSEQTSDLPTQLEDKISEIEAEYSGKDYEPVSFLSSNNTKINLVQFVLKTSDITLPDQDEVMTVEQPKKTLWQRFIQLFQA